MTCTIWETGQAVIAIPYGMKKEYNQHPSDVLPKFRHSWVRINYAGGKYRLGINEFVEVPDSIDTILEEDRKLALECRRKLLNLEIADLRKSFKRVSEAAGRIEEGVYQSGGLVLDRH
jgi:hypothetical protein